MAGKGRIANLVPFKPGQSGNPAGRAGVLPPEIRAARKANQAELISKITQFFKMTAEKVGELLKQDKATQLDFAVQALIGKAKEGDVPAFKYLIETMTGKIPEHDYDGYTEEDIRILNRVKEVWEEHKRNLAASEPAGSRH